MKCFKEFEPESMGSGGKWRRMMYLAGRPCEMIKADWNHTLPHASVSTDYSSRGNYGVPPLPEFDAAG